MIDHLREALDLARAPQNAATVNREAGAGAMPDEPLALGELRAMCAAARDRGFNAGYDRGYRVGDELAAGRVAMAQREGETAGAVAALEAIRKVLHESRPPSSDRTKGADGQRALGAALAGQIADLIAEVERGWLHAEPVDDGLSDVRVVGLV